MFQRAHAMTPLSQKGKQAKMARYFSEEVIWGQARLQPGRKPMAPAKIPSGDITYRLILLQKGMPLELALSGNGSL